MSRKYQFQVNPVLSPSSIANPSTPPFTSGQLVTALISFTSMWGSANANVCVKMPPKKEKGGGWEEE